MEHSSASIASWENNKWLPRAPNMGSKTWWRSINPRWVLAIYRSPQDLSMHINFNVSDKFLWLNKMGIKRKGKLNRSQRTSYPVNKLWLAMRTSSSRINEEFQLYCTMPVYSNAILSVICLHLFINYKDFQNPFLLNYPVLSLHHILLNFSIFQGTSSFTSVKEF